MSNTEDAMDNVKAVRPTRGRKQVERLVVEPAVVQKVLEIPVGAGVVLGEYEYFATNFDKLKTDDDVCKQLHLLLFNSQGTKNDRKKNIRKFNGFEGPSLDVSDKVQKLIERKSATVSILKVSYV
jgi:hypothetical protein